MANKTFQGRIVQKHDTKANWDKATNFVPLKGEIIIYDDLNKIKIGDGSTKINDLKFDTATFYVKVTQGTGNSVTADKTAKEIYDAYQTGYAVSAIAQFNSINYPYILPLAAINENNGIIIIGFGALGSTSLTTAPQYPTICYTGSEWQMWIGELVRNTDLATVAISGSYNDLTNKPTIPTTISQLEDDTIFIVTMTGKGTADSPYTIDSDTAKITTQYNLNKKVYLKNSNKNILLPLVGTGNNASMFGRLSNPGQITYCVIQGSTVVTYNTHLLENAANKVTTLSSSSTNTQYPSAKAVYDAIPHPDIKTDAQTQTVGIDANGKLWTNASAVTSVNGKTGAVQLTTADINLDSLKEMYFGTEGTLSEGDISMSDPSLFQELTGQLQNILLTLAPNDCMPINVSRPCIITHLNADDSTMVILKYSGVGDLERYSIFNGICFDHGNGIQYSVNLCYDIDGNSIDQVRLTKIPNTALPAVTIADNGKFLRVISGEWIATTAPNKFTFTATAGQSTFTIPFDFDDSSALTVYYNGIMMKETDNYTVSGKVITLTGFTAEAGDYLTVMGIEGAAAIDFGQEATKAIAQMNTAKSETITAINNIKSQASTEIGTVKSNAINEINNLVATLPSDTTNLMYKNKTNTMTSAGKITMDTNYAPSADGDIATKKYVDNHVPDIDPPVGTSTNYAIYIGATAPASGTTPLLWIDTSSSGTFKYRTSTTGAWKPVPVAWS